MSADDSAINPKLWAAYQDAEYSVNLHGGTQVLSLGQRLAPLPASPPLGIITACNPGSQHYSNAHNCDRTSRLRRFLLINSAQFWTGNNRDRSQQWPDEASFLIAGFSLEQLHLTAARFQQLAWLLIGSDQTPRLVLTRSE